MLYEVARSELQRPPKRVSWTDLSLEATTLAAIAFGLLWLV
jgi:hypothetical protein